MEEIFKAYDIRGVYPEEINETIMQRIGFAYASYLNKKNIVIGHDMRNSSPALSKAFSDGVRAFGSDVFDIGLSTTPMLYSAIIDGNYDGGAMITASHLEGQFNGVKLCRQKAIPLSGVDGLPEIKNIYTKTQNISGIKTGNIKQVDFLNRYLDKVSEFIKPVKPLKIVVDAGNGMGGLDTPKLFEKFPNCQFIPMYMNLDGNFPHHTPNPVIPENTAELQKRVIEEKADLGFAFDGDADRCGFVDGNGERVPADFIIPILSEYFLKYNPGATILYDLRSSKIVPEQITTLGGNPIITRVGHSFIKEKMREVNAIFAGELSGHYYYSEMGFIDSGILSMITMLNLLTINLSPLSKLVKGLNKYARLDETNFNVKDTKQLFAELEKTYSDAKKEHIDGLSVDYHNWWFNLRESNTEPVVRLVMGAANNTILEKEKTTLLKIINKYK